MISSKLEYFAYSRSIYYAGVDPPNFINNKELVICNQSIIRLNTANPRISLFLGAGTVFFSICP